MADRRMNTPRTDALLLEINEGRAHLTESPMTEHARELETELAAARAEILWLEAKLAQINKAPMFYANQTP